MSGAFHREFRDSFRGRSERAHSSYTYAPIFSPVDHSGAAHTAALSIRDGTDSGSSGDSSSDSSSGEGESSGSSGYIRGGCTSKDGRTSSWNFGRTLQLGELPKKTSSSSAERGSGKQQDEESENQCRGEDFSSFRREFFQYSRRSDAHRTFFLRWKKTNFFRHLLSNHANASDSEFLKRTYRRSGQLQSWKRRSVIWDARAANHRKKRVKHVFSESSSNTIDASRGFSWKDSAWLLHDASKHDEDKYNFSLNENVSKFLRHSCAAKAHKNDISLTPGVRDRKIRRLHHSFINAYCDREKKFSNKVLKKQDAIIKQRNRFRQTSFSTNIFVRVFTNSNNNFKQ